MALCMLICDNFGNFGEQMMSVIIQKWILTLWNLCSCHFFINQMSKYWHLLETKVSKMMKKAGHNFCMSFTAVNL